ncbi:hypothetical protein ACWEKM_04625 [Streptomyces sp. NPDC004752]
MSASILLIAASLFFLPTAAHAAATVTYVDRSAAAGGDGRSASPYNSLAAVDALTFGSGDHIHFKRGATCTGQFSSGTAGAPITVAAYGTDTARPVIAGGGVSTAVHLYNVEQWEINDLEITNTGASTGVYDGIQVELHDFGTGRAASGALVEHNTVYDIWMRSADNNAGVWTVNPDDTVIRHNEVYRVHRPALNDGMAFDSDLGNRGTVIQYNHSHDNQGGFLLLYGTCNTGSSTSGTVVRYNRSVNDGSRLLFGSGEDDAHIYNNTLYLPSGSTTLIVEDVQGTTHAFWSNNVIDNQGSGGYGGTNYVPGNYVWRGNVLYGNHPANEPTDPGKVTANPLLTSPGSTTPTGYQLQAGSPALGAGQVTTDSGKQDYFGNAAPTVCRPDTGYRPSPSNPAPLM